MSKRSTLDEIYLYEPKSRMQVYLKDCDGSLEFMRGDGSLLRQIYLVSCLSFHGREINLSLEVIFSDWEVRV